MTLLALDTETTGLDLWHNCKPFLCMGVDDRGEVNAWRWRVNPLSREVTVPNSDRLAIAEYLDSYDRIVCHNAKFDLRALEMVGIPLPKDIWDRVDDTIIASHCLASAGPHDLKTLALQHCNILDDDKDALRTAAMSARRIGKKLGWRNAEPGDPHWPTVKNAQSGMEWWAADGWMPGELYELAGRVVIDENGDDHTALEEYEVPEEWSSVCETYCQRDVERTIGLWYVFREALKEQDLWEKYEVRRKLLKATYLMEQKGMTLRRFRTGPVREKHEKMSAMHQSECYRVVNNQIDNLDSPKQLTSALYNILNLPIVKRTKKTGQPSTDKDTLEALKLECTPQSKAGWFLRHLGGYRKRSHAAETVETYELGGIDLPNHHCKDDAPYFTVLHCNSNITGTDTTRMSINNPNGSNVAKGEGLPPEEGFNLRELFGPAPGRVWYSHDYDNQEMRIFAHMAGERELIEAFERGESAHLVVCELLFPREYAECLRSGESFKKKYKATLYQWVKNGNFSLIYGAGVRRADATYHVKGAYHKVRGRFHHIDSFMRTSQDEAKSKGYITTLGGYRLQVPDNAAHKAVNYKVQGSAGYAMSLAIGRVREYLDTLNDHHLIMYIHDELLHDVPEVHDERFPYEIKRLMEMSGQDLGLKLPVEMSRIRVSWDADEEIKPRKRKGPVKLLVS